MFGNVVEFGSFMELILGTGRRHTRFCGLLITKYNSGARMLPQAPSGPYQLE